MGLLLWREDGSVFFTWPSLESSSFDPLLGSSSFDPLWSLLCSTLYLSHPVWVTSQSGSAVSVSRLCPLCRLSCVSSEPELQVKSYYYWLLISQSVSQSVSQSASSPSMGIFVYCLSWGVHSDRWTDLSCKGSELQPPTPIFIVPCHEAVGNSAFWFVDT
jgi:hypothetical protein